MKERSRIERYFVITFFLLCSQMHLLAAQPRAQTQPAGKKETMVTGHATGTFEVRVIPQTADAPAQAANISRMSLDKQWRGELTGISTGEMLSLGTGAKGSSGGYVALERFTGELKGRRGSFVLQHTATMSRGVAQLTIFVVPDSGTGQLAGITGKMSITIIDGKHSYDFEYTLPEPR